MRGRVPRDPDRTSGTFRSLGGIGSCQTVNVSLVLESTGLLLEDREVPSPDLTVRGRGKTGDSLVDT